MMWILRGLTRGGSLLSRQASAVRAEVAVTSQSADASSRLHRKLSTFAALLLTLSCLSPVFSVYGPGSDVLQHAGTGAAHEQ